MTPGSLRDLLRSFRAVLLSFTGFPWAGRTASQDSPWALSLGNPSDQPCQSLKIPICPSSFTQINPVPACNEGAETSPAHSSYPLPPVCSQQKYLFAVTQYQKQQKSVVTVTQCDKLEFSWLQRLNAIKNI